MKASQSAIEIKELTRRYGKLEAVHDLSLTVRAGSCYGFFGRNGAGKTTTIKCLLNLLRPQSGSCFKGVLPKSKSMGAAVVSRLMIILNSRNCAIYDLAAAHRAAVRCLGNTPSSCAPTQLPLDKPLEPD